jgi:NitT/TauT family transport system ATP-binding protein
MANISVSSVSHSYSGTGQQRTIAVQDVSFTIAAGEFCAIVGPSGCGKSTLLRILAGLTIPTRGSVTVTGAPVTGPSPNAAVVFQDYSRSLLPWLTVEENVALALRHRNGANGEGSATEYLAGVGLSGAGSKYPWQLSGGMQQRVAIARALASRSRVLLMDEPFGSLDALTRFALEDLIIDTHRRFGLTVLLVTHDVDEAIYMADRVLIMDRDGRLISADGTVVNLTRPRHQKATRQADTFAAIRGRVLTDLGVLPRPS